MPVELGQGAAYPSSHGYPLRQSTRGAAHPQSGGTKFTDLDAAAGLRALQKRIHLVPGAVHEFLQAGGISAAVTILCSQPLHADLRDAAVTLLQAVLQKLPDEASSAFMEARGMQAAVYLLGNSTSPHSRSMASDGLSTAHAAAALIEAVLDAAPQSASLAFHDAGGLLTVRMCITCAKLGKPHELEVAEAALCVLHALLMRIRVRADTKRVLCHAVIAADLHQPLLALLHIHPTSMGSSKAVECLAALAETNAANVRVLAKDGCMAALLSVIGHADAASKSARSAVVLLQFLVQHQSSVRVGLATNSAQPILIRNLAAVESQDPISTDALSSILRMLVPQPDELGCREGKRACHWAAFYGTAQLLQDLVERHPNLEAKDRRGNTALHLAAAANHLNCVELLLRGGADALARNFAGLQPHKLASPGSPAWEQLLAHLEWRSCLDEPRLCHFLPSELTSLPAMEQEWQGPARCYFLPLTGKLRLESADGPQQTPATAKSWIKRTLSGGVPAVEQAQASDANRSGCLICEFAVPAQTQIDEIDCHTLGLTLIDSEGGEGVNKPPCPVEKLLIRVEEPSDQTAADLAAALHLFIRHHHSGQAEFQHSNDNSIQVADLDGSGASSKRLSKASLQDPSHSSTLGAQQAAAEDEVAAASHVQKDAVSRRMPGSNTGADSGTPQATSEQHGSEADTVDHNLSKHQQPRRAELCDVPAPCELLESSGQEQPHHACSPFARGPPKKIPGMPTCHTFRTSCEQPLPQPQTQGACKRRARRAPPPPPPPPAPSPLPDTPRKAHDPLATAAAIQAVDQTRRQQRALAKTIVYAPHEASVATKVCELEKQIGRGRSHGPGMRGSADPAQEDASLLFGRHMSEQLVWESDLRACTDMQRQRSHSDPTVPSQLRRLSPVGREWEQLQEDPSRVRRHVSPFEKPFLLRDSQAPESLVGSEVVPGHASSQSSDIQRSQPDPVQKVCSDEPTAHVLGVRIDPQAETPGKVQSADHVLQLQQQHISHPEQAAVQTTKTSSGKGPAVQALQAGKLASQPIPGHYAREVAASPAEQSTTRGPKADHNPSTEESGSSSRNLVADSPVTGKTTPQNKLQEPGAAAGLHQQGVPNQHRGDVAGSQSCGRAPNAEDPEDAGNTLMSPSPGAGVGRRSKPFAYGPRSLPAEKVLAGSEVYGIAANGSAASTHIRHVQPDADQPAIGSIIPPRKPFAYGPRGAAVRSSAACDINAGSDRQLERGWSAADPRFTNPQRISDAARVQAKLGQRQQDWAKDPRFA